MGSRNVLALDLASETGFAIGEPGQLPRIGSLRFAAAGATHPAIYSAAMSWIARTIREEAIVRVVVETPLNPNFKTGFTNIGTIRLLMGLAAVMEGAAHKLGVWHIEEIAVMTWRKHVLGKGNIKGPAAKKMVLRLCRDLGMEPRNNNESDAAGLWFAATKYPIPPELIGKLV